MPGKANTIEELHGRVVAAETFADPPLMLDASLPAAGEKDLPLSQAAQLFLSGADVPAQGMGGPSNPFRQSLWVYRCISVIAMNAARVPLRLSRAESTGTRSLWGARRVRVGRHKGRKIRTGEKAHLKAREGEIVEGGPLHELLTRPNPDQTWFQFALQTIGLLYDQGRVHWLFDDMTGRRPGSMYAVSGKWTKPLTKKVGRVKVLVGWEFREPGRAPYPVALDEIITFQLFNPDDPHAGLAPKVPATLAIVSDYNASLYNAAMFGNSAEPGGALQTDAPFNAAQDEQLRTGWHQRHRGAAKAKALAILWGGLKWQSIASSMKDMQYGEGKRLTRTETCAAYGVPEVVAGFYTDANYQFAEQGRMQFWQETEMPLLDLFAEGIEVHLCSRFEGNLEAWFDAEDVPIVQTMRKSQLEAVDKLWAKGVPLRDLNNLYDLGVADQDWHAEGFLPIGVQRARDAAAGQLFEPVNEGPSSETSDELDQADRAPGTRDQGPGEEEARDDEESAAQEVAKAARERIWAEWATSVKPLHRIVERALRTRYLAQQRLVVKLLKARLPAPADQAARGAPESKDQLLVAQVLFDVFGSTDNRRRFRARMTQFTTDANELGVRQALSEAGLTGPALEDGTRRLLSSPRIVQAIRSDALRVSTLVDNYTRQLLRDHLAQGVAAGEDVRKLADRVQAVMGNRRAAAMSVARNSVGQALSSSRHAGHLAAGMTHKGWIHSRGPGDRRPGHVEAEGRYMPEPIPLTQPFIINGVRLMYPRDFSAGRPAETINCQCLQIAKRLAAPQRSVSMAELMEPCLAKGFYSYHDMLLDRTGAKGNANGE